MNRRIKGNGKSDLSVNGALILRAMTDERLSSRELARRVGLTINIIYRMTKHNAFSADLPARYLIDIAEHLHLNVSDLITTHAHPIDDPDWGATDEREQQRDAEADMMRLAHQLVMDTTSHHPADLSYAFGWQIERLHAARRLLNDHLKPLGLQARNANDCYYLAPLPRQRTRSEIIDDHRRVAIVASNHRRIDPSLARVLHDTLHHRLTTARGNNERVKLAQAVNLGCVGAAPGKYDYTATDAFLDAFPESA